jgi:outer membrane protein TolC
MTLRDYRSYFLLLALGCALPPPAAFPGRSVEVIIPNPSATLEHPILPKLTLNLSDGLSPDEAAMLAVLYNPDLVTLRDERGLAAAALLAAGLLPNPTLSLSTDVPVFGVTDGTNVAAGASLGWELSALFRRDLLLTSAKAHSEGVLLEIAWREWALAEEAKRLTWRVYYLSQKAKLTAQNELLLQASYELLQKAVALREKTALELSAAEVAWRDAREASFVANAEAQEAIAQLTQAIGLTQNIPVTETLTPTWQAQEVTALVAGIDDHRLDLAALRYAYQSEDAAVRAAVQASFPTIGAELNVSRDTSALNSVGAAVQIELPVFQKNQGAIETEKAVRQQLVDEYVARRYQAKQEIEQLAKSLQSALAHRALLEELIPSLEALNKSYQLASEGGYVDILSRYTAQDLLAQKRLALIDIELQLSELTVALELASGVLITEKKP